MVQLQADRQPPVELRTAVDAKIPDGSERHQDCGWYRYTGQFRHRADFQKLVGTQKFLRPRPDGLPRGIPPARPTPLPVLPRCFPTGRYAIRQGTQRFLRPYKILVINFL